MAKKRLDSWEKEQVRSLAKLRVRFHGGNLDEIIASLEEKTLKQKNERNQKWYQDYLKSDHWKEKRLEAFAFYGRVCARCGSTGGLDVHHKRYGNVHKENMEDLEILCRDCHAKHHEKA